MPPPDLLQHLFAAAIASAQPAPCVPPCCPRPEEVKGRLVVLGAGKASAAMAQVVEQHWPGPLSGLVVTRYGYQVPCQRIEVVQAAHPVPDAAGLHAAQRMLALAEGLTADDVVLALISVRRLGPAAFAAAGHHACRTSRPSTAPCWPAGPVLAR